MLKNLLSAAVVIGALRVKSLFNICLPDCFVVIFLLSAYFFQNHALRKNYFRNTIRVSNKPDPDQKTSGHHCLQ